MSKRFKGYFFYRERESDEVTWLRPTDSTLLQLPRPIVLINGAFDILHTPHMRLIYSAADKAKSGSVVCALDSDKRIKASKGPERPILTFPERAAAFNYMPVTALVEIDSEADMVALIKHLRPDIRVQGTEYKDRQSRFRVRKMLVRNGKPHTTDIINRIIERYNIDNSTTSKSR